MTFDDFILLPLGMGSVEDADVFAAILDSSGQVLNARHFGGSTWDYCSRLLTTKDGCIYLSGQFYSPEFKIDSLTLINNGGGHHRFARRIFTETGC